MAAVEAADDMATVRTVVNRPKMPLKTDETTPPRDKGVIRAIMITGTRMIRMILDALSIESLARLLLNDSTTVLFSLSSTFFTVVINTSSMFSFFLARSSAVTSGVMRAPCSVKNAWRGASCSCSVLGSDDVSQSSTDTQQQQQNEQATHCCINASVCRWFVVWKKDRL
jgi:hypothetical protein